MIRKNILLSLLVMGCAASKTQAQKVDLQPVWGEKNISSSSDLSGSAEVFSDGEALHLKVVVRDDKVVSNRDPLRSDHVELWFALAGDSGAGNMLSDVYIYNDTLFSPVETGQSLEEIFSSFISTEDGEEASVPKGFRKTRVFYGLAHIGLYPDGRPAVLLDREFYRGIAGFEPDSVLSCIQYTAKKTKHGYTIEAVIPPEAMLWASSRQIDQLLWLCDVVDVDGKKQESLLSSSRKRKWADISTFSRLRLKKPLVVKQIKEKDAKAIEQLNSIYSDVASAVWLFAGNKWKPVLVNVYERWEFGDYILSGYSSPVLYEIDIAPAHIKWVKRGSVEEMRIGGIRGFFVDDRLMAQCYAVEPNIVPLSFPDKTKGLLLSYVDVGAPGLNPMRRCGASLTCYLKVFKGFDNPGRADIELSLNACFPYIDMQPGDVEELLSKVSYASYDEEVWQVPEGWKAIECASQDSDHDIDLDNQCDWPVAYRVVKDKKGNFKALEVMIVGSDDFASDQIWQTIISFSFDKKRPKVKKISEKRIY